MNFCGLKQKSKSGYFSKEPRCNSKDLLGCKIFSYFLIMNSSFPENFKLKFDMY